MTKMLPRLLKIKLPKGQSAFLWGPRKTGKTTFLRGAFPDSLTFDLLQTDLFLEFVKRPFLLREQLLSVDPLPLKGPVIIDEVQKVPPLLAEIHWLIDPTKSLITTFISGERNPAWKWILSWAEGRSPLR
jgi:predicted AAA+ superfamily ATPase